MTIFVSGILFISRAFAGPDTIPVLNFTQLEPIFHPSNDTVYVINFWATWCQPCVEELPYLEKLTKKYKDKKLRVILVSLDFKSQLHSKLVPFVEKNNLLSDLVMLHDNNADEWIPKVSDHWDGAIPFTIILKGEKRVEQLEKFENYKALKNAVNALL